MAQINRCSQSKCSSYLHEKLRKLDITLIWSADFILDTDADSISTYILSEINCS